MLFTGLQADKIAGMGLLYGGGLSWYTNQHGLASDNAVAFDLVLPNGTYVNVTQQTQPNLYFSLRGGLNNFGIITGVTVKTWPTGGVWVSTSVSSYKPLKTDLDSRVEILRIRSTTMSKSCRLLKSSV